MTFLKMANPLIFINYCLPFLINFVIYVNVKSENHLFINKHALASVKI